MVEGGETVVAEETGTEAETVVVAETEIGIGTEIVRVLVAEAGVLVVADLAVVAAGVGVAAAAGRGVPVAGVLAGGTREASRGPNRSSHPICL